MDDEDLADAADAQSLQTQQSYSGFGITNDDGKRQGLLMELLKPQGDTMGVKLLRKMGWRDGQGVGPKVRRTARLDGNDDASRHGQEIHLFAPSNSEMMKLHRKHDRKGLGHAGETSLDQEFDSRRRASDRAGSDSNEDRGDNKRLSLLSNQPSREQSVAKRSGGFGVGISNDDEPEDEDDGALGPRLSFHRTIGREKKVKKKAQKQTPVTSLGNPLLKSRPIFRSRKALESRSGFRKCHDGRLPLDGFVLSDLLDTKTLGNEFQDKHSLPQVPEGWKSMKAASAQSFNHASYQSAADAAKASTLDPKSRAAVLGESQLPGKSVFDYLSPTARDRLAAASGRSNLPDARGERIPGAESRNAAEMRSSSAIPPLDKNVALAALGRGDRGWMPYADNEQKRSRYKAFLEFHTTAGSELATRPSTMKQDTWIQELREFAHAAEIFKPMSASMASRFASSTTLPGSQTDAPTRSGTISTGSKAQKPEDPAESAAKMSMFGPMTRSEHLFYPTRLLCKRFNVRLPLHAESDPAAASRSGITTGALRDRPESKGPSSNGHSTPSEATTESFHIQRAGGSGRSPRKRLAITNWSDGGGGGIDTSHNEALEGQRAGDELFKAVFGDDGDD